MYFYSISQGHKALLEPELKIAKSMMSVHSPVVTYSGYFPFKEANIFTDESPKTFMQILKKWQCDQNTVTQYGTNIVLISLKF